VVRTKAAPGSIASSVQKEIVAVDPEQPAYHIKTMGQWTQDSLALRRLGTLLLSAFSGVALVLAAVGIYGVMAFWVGQRSREFGIRLALGAQRVEVLDLVLRRGLRLAVVGVIAGLLGAIALTRVLNHLLFQVSPGDPITFAGVALLLVAVALLACWLPARRAMKVDPMSALRCE